MVGVYAEALAEGGSIAQSDLDISINRLRDRAEVGRMNVAVIDENFDPDRDKSVDPVLWEIRRERLIELMGESFSFEDVRRWKKGPQYFRTIQVAEISPSLLLTRATVNRQWDDKYYFYPIPMSELKKNANLAQNPGW